ncbi:MAG: SH3 domain-containing protein [Acetatifactor sp.]|nr:SH3 domain-containing protein [Acetatifactor sp.]
MKKKMFVALLSFALTASIACGCGNKTNQSMAAEGNSTATESVEPTNENVSAKDTESTDEAEESKETAPEVESTPEPTQAPESTPNEKESSQETETSKESEAESKTTPAPVETSTPTAENPDTGVSATPEVTYTVTEMSATMYAVNAVNLRQGPGTEYAKVGNLTKGQQVKVTGQAGNGWYQLDNGAFVSNKYLGDTAPAQQATATVPNAPADSTGTVIPVGTETESFGGTSVDFINYLNQQRSTVGLGTLTWDDNLAALAEQRAQQIASNYSHDGSPSGCGEIILYTYDSSYSAWYDIWYGSTAHKESMFLSSYEKAACGYYFNGYYYYVVTLFQQKELTQDELQQIMNPDNMVQISDNVYVPKDQVEYITPMNPNDPEDAAALEKMEEEKKKLEDGTLDRVFD